MRQKKKIAGERHRLGYELWVVDLERLPSNPSSACLIGHCKHIVGIRALVGSGSALYPRLVLLCTPIEQAKISTEMRFDLNHCEFTGLSTLIDHLDYLS